MVVWRYWHIPDRYIMTDVAASVLPALRISVALPGSSLSDESTKMDKTRKISVLARACAIFGIETIYVYREGDSKEDANLLVTVLRYLETPQFLRKRLFPRMNELKFAGVLHPLQIPSHNVPPNPKKITAGDARDGLVVSLKGRRFVDVGIRQLIPYHGSAQVGKRILLKFKKGHPDFELTEIARTDVREYWGYAVRERASLPALLSEWNGNAVLTSRKAKPAKREHVAAYAKSGLPLLVAFGSPDKGLHEILGNHMKKIQNTRTLNFFPGQATQTVRLEEALLGTLSVIDAYAR